MGDSADYMFFTSGALCNDILILQKRLIYFNSIYLFCHHVCLCTTYVSGAHRIWKRALDPLELELQTALNYHVGSGFSERVASALKC